MIFQYWCLNCPALGWCYIIDFPFLVVCSLFDWSSLLPISWIRSRRGSRSLGYTNWWPLRKFVLIKCEPIGNDEKSFRCSRRFTKQFKVHLYVLYWHKDLIATKHKNVFIYRGGHTWQLAIIMPWIRILVVENFYPNSRRASEFCILARGGSTHRFWYFDSRHCLC